MLVAKDIIYYLFLSLIAAIFSFLVVRLINYVVTKNGLLTYGGLAFLNGLIEILMFSASILVNIPMFIAFWVSVKTALAWTSNPITKKKKDKQPKDEGDKNKENKENKFTYLRFLIGNSINIILSYFIASVIRGEMIIFK